MVLKLKDWPPGEDFRDMMPSRYDYGKGKEMVLFLRDDDPGEMKKFDDF